MKTKTKIKTTREKFVDAINEAGEGVDSSNRDLIATYALDDCMKIAREHCLGVLNKCKTMDDVSTIKNKLLELINK